MLTWNVGRFVLVESVCLLEERATLVRIVLRVFRYCQYSHTRTPRICVTHLAGCMRPVLVPPDLQDCEMNVACTTGGCFETFGRGKSWSSWKHSVWVLEASVVVSESSVSSRLWQVQVEGRRGEEEQDVAEVQPR